MPSGTPGLSFPRRYTFMGRRGCVVGEVEFDDCRVPADHLLGDANGGSRIMVGMFNFERIILGGSGLGVARSAFDIAQAHAQTREAFGEKLGCKQLVWSQIADMSCRIDASELLTYRAAKLYDAGVRGKHLMKPAAMAKLVATETATFCADRTVQILGGDGTHQGIRTRRADLPRRPRAADRRRHVGDGEVPDRRRRSPDAQAQSLSAAARRIMDIATIFLQSVERYPNHTALIFEDRRWTYARLVRPRVAGSRRRSPISACARATASRST